MTTGDDGWKRQMYTHSKSIRYRGLYKSDIIGEDKVGKFMCRPCDVMPYTVNYILYFSLYTLL